MLDAQSENNSQIEQQWKLLEEHYRQNKPILAHLAGITDGKMLVHIGGIQGTIDTFVYAFTQQTPIEENPLGEGAKVEKIETSFVQEAQYHLTDLRGKEILLSITERDRKKNILKLSQKLYKGEKSTVDEFKIGSTQYGIITAINLPMVRVDLQGVIGRLTSHDTTLYLGQKIEVHVEKKQGRSLSLSF